MMIEFNNFNICDTFCEILDPFSDVDVMAIMWQVLKSTINFHAFRARFIWR